MNEVYFLALFGTNKHSKNLRPIFVHLVVKVWKPLFSLKLYRFFRIRSFAIWSNIRHLTKSYFSKNFAMWCDKSSKVVLDPQSLLACWWWSVSYVMPCHAMSCYVMVWHTSCHVTSHHIIHIVSYRILSYHIASYFIISWQK